MKQITAELARGISRPGAGRARDLLVEIDRLIASMDPRRQGFVRNWIRTNIPRAFVLGDRGASRALQGDLNRIASGQGFGNVNRTFTGLNQTQLRAVTAAFESTMGRAAADIRATIGTVVRQTQVTLQQSARIREATVGGIIRGKTGAEVSNDIAEALLGPKITPEIRRRLKEHGFRGDQFDAFERIARQEYIKVGKRTMSVRNYANLVARTQMREAHKVGTIARLQQNGVDHVRISRHPQAEIDECTPYAGKIFYVGSEAKDPLGFPKLSETPNGGPPFHPNCKHVLEPYVVAFKSPKAVAEDRESSRLLNGSGLLGKTGSEVRKALDGFSDKDLREIAPEGFEDVA